MMQRFEQSTRPTHLPPQTTPFIGREKEVADITRLLSEPACALLTLVGPGGIGKTRLAIQAAGAVVGAFEQGVYFVPLQAVTSQDFLISAIADTLKFSLSGHDPPDVQLRNYLGHKEILLVLDNFEQLLTSPFIPPAGGERGRGEEATTLLVDLLAAAPSVKLLVTSREVLNLQEEWLYPVPGLPVPGAADQDDLESYGAVSLFVERTRRVRRGFSLSEEQVEVGHICRLVEGMPLAIELAAAWTKTLSCAAIVAELQRNLDFLTTTLRNVPARHRSMQAVFNNSWQRLTEKEQAVFKRLSIFRGGFRREAAEQVAGATLPILTALVDKSLLQWGANDRYQIHELLRQYAAEQLQASPEEVVDVQNLHCTYYADFLNTRQEAMGASREMQNVIRELRADWENIRVAWQWAVDQKKVPEIYKAGDTFYNFCQAQSRYREGEAALEKAIRVLEQLEPDELQGKTLAGLLVGHGWLCIRLGYFQKAQAGLEQSRALYQQLNLQPPPYSSASDPLGPLSILATIRGDYDEALKLGHESRQRCEVHTDKKNLEYAFYALTSAAFAKGELNLARRYAEQAYATSIEISDRWTMAYIVSDLGNIARVQGDYAQAKQHYQTSYDLREEMDDPEGMAAALNRLGELAWLEQAYHEADQLYRQSLALYRDIGDQGGLATTLKGLGQTACALGQYQSAQEHFHEALQISTKIEFVPLTLAILIGIGELLLQIGGLERGVELMTLTLNHPAGDQETKDKAQALLKQYETQLPPDRFASAQLRGQTGSLDSAIAALQAVLSDAEGLVGAGVPAASQLAQQANQALLDPLSDRELEVLQHIAAGLKNREIAEELVVTLSTVKAHINSIYRKLDVNSRVQAVARARELNLLP